MKSNLFLLFLLFVLACSSEDDYQLLKKYRPEDKYFSSTLKELHFVIETREIEYVDNFYKRIMETYQLPIDASGCEDGVYTAESIEDAYDYRHVIKIEIKDEKIVSVDYNEIGRNDKGKEESNEYCEEMSVAGTTPAIAYPNYEKQLLQKQSLNEVDGVSGATYSLYRFKKTLTMALMKAKLHSAE